MFPSKAHGDSKSMGGNVYQYNTVPATPPTEQPRRRTKRKLEPPQKEIDQFWDRFTTKNWGKTSTILPDKFHAVEKSDAVPTGEVSGKNAAISWEQASALCKAKVERIAKECRRVNKKYRDFHFDIEFDLMQEQYDCLTSLDSQPDPDHIQPRAVKRVPDIFKDPKFYIDGASASDVRQGYEGNCWFLAAICALCNKKDFIKDRICIKKDEEVGVYGFVFYRDGEWISEVIDDNLYLTKPDFDKMDLRERSSWEELANRSDPEGSWQQTNQLGSQALHFAQCRDPQETWLPLLEKAYAKVHGDYSAIAGGFVGEGLEDLTGGVTTEIFTSDILNKEDFWRDELMKVNSAFLFGCGTGRFATSMEEKGIHYRHAYSIMDAVEEDPEPGVVPKEALRDQNGETRDAKDRVQETQSGEAGAKPVNDTKVPDKIRLLKLRNPWGKSEWTGPWSDGSKEWTPYWMGKLKHGFDNDGTFWMSYDDLLRRFQYLDRTRLFSKEWTKAQQWTSLNVPWSVNYSDTAFQVTIVKKARIVFVLSQLDTRYFRGLDGQYRFQLQFRLKKEGSEDYLLRSHTNLYMHRSVSAEHEGLDPGKYIVHVKVTAVRDREKKSPLDVIRSCCQEKREKLLSIGLKYDLAHAKGGFQISQREQKARQKQERKDEKRKERERDRVLLKHEKLRESRRRWKNAKRTYKDEKAKSAVEARAEQRSPVLEPGSAPSIPIMTRQASSSDAGSNVANAAASDTAEFQTAEFQTETPRTEDAIGIANLPNPTYLRVSALGRPPENTLEDISDTEYSWNSATDMDGPFGGILDDEDDSSLDLANDEDEEPDEFEADPWNAICIVGLRIYSLNVDDIETDVKIEVIKLSKINRNEVHEQNQQKKLDWDDPSHDATRESYHMQSLMSPALS